VSLIVGLLKLYDSRPKVLEKIFAFMSSDTFLEDANVKKELDDRGIDLTLLIMTLIFSSNEKISTLAFESLKSVSKTSKLGSVVDKLDHNLGRDKASSTLIELTNFESASNAIETVLSCKTMQEPEVISCVLLLAASALKSIGSNVDGIRLGQKMTQLTLLATQSCKIDVREDDAGDAFHELVDVASRKKSIPDKVFIAVVVAFKSLPKFCPDSKSLLRSCLQVFVLGSSLKVAGLEAAAEESFNIFAGNEELLMPKIAAMKRPKEIFPPQKPELDSGRLADLFDLAQLHCAKKISIESDPGMLPYLLTCLANENRKVRKTVFKVIENLSEKSSTKKNKLAIFQTLLKQIVEHRSEILSNFENLKNVISELINNEANENVLDNIFGQIIATESANVFVQVLDFTDFLKSSIV